MIYFKQCNLEKQTQEGTKKLTSWLPEQFANKGKYVELKDNNKWENGWQVVSFGTERLDEKAVGENSRDYRSQRLASDIFRGSSKK